MGSRKYGSKDILALIKLHREIIEYLCDKEESRTFPNYHRIGKFLESCNKIIGEVNGH